ncbi:hypothetical protein ACOTIX_21985 [Achromobacter xylosoxidans]
MNAVTKAGRDLELSLHLDGARLWHATAATGISEADYAATFVFDQRLLLKGAWRAGRLLLGRR